MEEGDKWCKAVLSEKLKTESEKWREAGISPQSTVHSFATHCGTIEQCNNKRSETIKINHSPLIITIIKNNRPKAKQRINRKEQ
ncbi:hypothetical protein BKI52_06820 [marine bacterium AO1-C]|nr:hypothetical protein BKI52_06820 [marine bacterium AO1-C]